MLEAVCRWLSGVVLVGAAAWNQAAAVVIVVALVLFIGWVVCSDERTTRLKRLLQAARRRP